MDETTGEGAPVEAGAASPSAAPPKRARPGFLRRRRATLLTLGIVLYTAALGVAICDDAFHLGLFPTAYEKEARGYIRQFDSADEAARREAADKLASSVDGFVAVPELIRALGSPSLQVREGAIGCLRKITKADVPFDPAASPAERRAAIASWRKWWAENRDRF